MTITVDGEETEFTASSDSPFAAYVFKSISDPFAGHITLMRVFSGGVATDANVTNSTRDASERLSSLSTIQGKEVEHVTELAAGDIIMTGTPAGVGKVRLGEHFQGRILQAGRTLVTASWVAQ